jgi:hypothetical protein
VRVRNFRLPPGCRKFTSSLRQGVGGTLYLAFVGAAQGAFYGAISGGGSGARQGAWIGAAVGTGVGLVLGSVEGWSRARDARTAYESAVANCRAAALVTAPAQDAAAPPPAPPPSNSVHESGGPNDK